jgi:hypothetical protein
METDFADIKIVSLEEELTVPSPNNPQLRYIYFKLTATPPPGWQKAFAQSRRVARHPKWRQAWIDRKFIILECLPEEIETHHLRDLKMDIYFANGEYRKYLQHQYHHEIKASETQSIERERLRALKDRLNFD